MPGLPPPPPPLSLEANSLHKGFAVRCDVRTPYCLTLQAPDDLVMSTGDEFRERCEEYQLIQSAIPSHDKYSSDG